MGDVGTRLVVVGFCEGVCAGSCCGAVVNGVFFCRQHCRCWVGAVIFQGRFAGSENEKTFCVFRFMTSDWWKALFHQQPHVSDSVRLQMEVSIITFFPP